MAALQYLDRATRRSTLEHTTDFPRARRKSARPSGAFAAGLAAAVAIFATQPFAAAEVEPTKIAVFEFELKDTSAGGGVIAADAIDTENLKKSTDEARRVLSELGRYSVVDTSSVAGEVTSAGGIQACDGCDGPLAKQLGADQSMVGVRHESEPNRIHAADPHQGSRDWRSRIQRLQWAHAGSELRLASHREAAGKQQSRGGGGCPIMGRLDAGSGVEHATLSLGGAGLGALGALAVVRIEHGFPQPDRFRRHLDQLVLLDIGERALEAELHRRRQEQCSRPCRRRGCW